MAAKHSHIVWKDIVNPGYIISYVTGVAFITFALKGFMIPNKFLDGGVTGMSILIHEVTHFPFELLVLLLNIPFLFLAYKLLGPTFVIQSVITIVLLALSVAFVDIEAVTSDPLLIALFGGCLIGVGMGLCVRGGCTADGAEVLAVLTIRNIGFTITEVIFAMNATIFLLAAYSFGITTALYSIITYFTAVKALEYVSEGIQHNISLHIISEKSEIIKSLIVNEYGKGITVIKGERGYLPGSYDVKVDCDIIVTIISRLELLNIKKAINTIDPNAFTYIHHIKEATGGILSHKNHH